MRSMAKGSSSTIRVRSGALSGMADQRQGQAHTIAAASDRAMRDAGPFPETRSQPVPHIDQPDPARAIMIRIALR